MSEDLRELLREAREWMADPPLSITEKPDSLRNRIDAALAEKAPEPVTSPPDVQNVPDVWGLLQSALSSIGEHTGKRIFANKEEAELLLKIDAALAVRDRFVLVPQRPTDQMFHAGAKAIGIKEIWYAMLAAAPKPEGKRDPLRGTPSAGFPEGE